MMTSAEARTLLEVSAWRDSQDGTTYWWADSKAFDVGPFASEQECAVYVAQHNAAARELQSSDKPARRSYCDTLPNPHLKPTEHKRPRQCAHCGAMATEYATGESADNVQRKTTWCANCVYLSQQQYWGNPARCK